MHDTDIYIKRCAELLLGNFSDEKIPVLYNSNAQLFLLPEIGPRPPYYIVISNIQGKSRLPYLMPIIFNS